MQILNRVLIAAALAAALPLCAAPTFTFGAGTAVFTTHRTATFDGVVSMVTDLTNYSEGNLDITVPALAFTGFSHPGLTGGFHYPNLGAQGPTVIKTTDAAILLGLEFNIANGYGPGQNGFAWETRLNNVATGAGTFELDFGIDVVFAIRDVAGFDTLLIAGYNSLADATANGGGRRGAEQPP